MRGKITHWGERAHYGFVTPDQPSHVDVFLHENDLPDAIRAGNARLGLEVEFDVVMIEGKAKPKAQNVCIILNGRCGSEGIT
jgi:cold shock CspA family protein